MNSLNVKLYNVVCYRLVIWKLQCEEYIIFLLLSFKFDSSEFTISLKNHLEQCPPKINVKCAKWKKKHLKSWTIHILIDLARSMWNIRTSNHAHRHHRAASANTAQSHSICWYFGRAHISFSILFFCSFFINLFLWIRARPAIKHILLNTFDINTRASKYPARNCKRWERIEARMAAGLAY